MSSIPFLIMIALLFVGAVGVMRLLSTLDHKPLYVIAAVICSTGLAWLIKGTVADGEGIVSLTLGVAALLLVCSKTVRHSSQDAPGSTNSPSLN